MSSVYIVTKAARPCVSNIKSANTNRALASLEQLDQTGLKSIANFSQKSETSLVF